MPQLPSGRHIALSPDRIMSMARKGDFTLTMVLAAATGTGGEFDILEVLDVVGFDPSDGSARYPGRPVLLGLLASAVFTDGCDWPDDDKTAFRTWLDEPRTQAWLESIQDELADVVEAASTELPENLQGVLDAD